MLDVIGGAAVVAGGGVVLDVGLVVVVRLGSVLLVGRTIVRGGLVVVGISAMPPGGGTNEIVGVGADTTASDGVAAMINPPVPTANAAATAARVRPLLDVDAWTRFVIRHLDRHLAS